MEVKLWLNCGLPGWTGPAWVWLAWLGWPPRCLVCRLDWPGLGLAGLDRLSRTRISHPPGRGPPLGKTDV